MIKKVLVGLIMVLVMLTAFNFGTERVEAASSKTKYVTASELNVRSGASTKHKVIKTVKKGQSVQVVGTKGTWDKIKIGKKTAWTSNKHLTTKKPAAKKSAPKPAPKKKVAKTTTMYVTASSLNVRSGASTKHKVITTAKKNTAVKVTQKKGTWSKVTIGKKTGWVSNKYLTTKKPAAKKAPKNLAEGLKTVGANKQLILVTSNGYNTTSATIQTFEKNSKGKWVQVLSTKGHIGKNGFAKSKKEGDGKTPVGKYTIGTGFGQKGNPGTKLPFKKITSDDIWVDDSKSKHYNSWQSKKKVKGQYKSAENMNHRLYTNGFVINYNTKRTPNKGSAIFFHVGNSYTLGCVATPESNVKAIMKWLDPSKKPVIIQTPTQDLGKY